MLLTNPDLLREIDDQRDEWEKQRISYQEKALEMEQKSLTLKQQTLEAAYELNKIRKSFAHGAGRIPYGHPQQGAAGSVGR